MHPADRAGTPAAVVRASTVAEPLSAVSAASPVERKPPVFETMIESREFTRIAFTCKLNYLQLLLRAANQLSLLKQRSR